MKIQVKNNLLIIHKIEKLKSQNIKIYYNYDLFYEDFDIFYDYINLSMIDFV